MTPADDQRVDTTQERKLGLQLHAFSNLVASTFYHRTEVPFGVSLPEWRVLQQAIASPNTSQGEVAAEHGLNVMNVSRAVSGLVRKGLIVVTTDPTDRRRRLLEPTPMGRDLGADIAKRASLMYGHLFGVLSRDELESLDAIMTKVNGVLREGDFPDLPEGSRPWAEVLRDRARDDAGRGA